MDHVKRAQELFLQKYNCAQAVACAFCDKAGLDQDALETLAENAKLQATRAKLNDIRLLAGWYQEYLGNKLHDLEDEAAEAVSRIGGAASFGGASAVVRPSGTEPKLKIYISVSAPDKAAAAEEEKKLAEDLAKFMA